MKKVFFAILALALIYGACEKPPEPVAVEINPASGAEATLSTITKNQTFYIKNNTGEEASITWQRTGTVEPTGWVYVVNGDTMDMGTITVGANDSVQIILTIHPNGTSGTGTGIITFYDERDQAATTQSYDYSLEIVNTLFDISPVGSMTDSARASNVKGYTIHLINNTVSTVVVKWEKIENPSNPSGWLVNVRTFYSATDSLSYSPSVDTGRVTIAPMDTVDFKGYVDPNGNVGMGGFDALFYVPTDSALTNIGQTINHSATL